MAGCALFFENTMQLSENILRFAMGRPEVYGSKSSTLIKNIVFFGFKLDEETISMGFLIQLIFVPYF
ncbi:hypothetical protein [Porphyromonas somerae]|uniref:hypothetical protein n=1 Tax=Porphyromonas somerae TaxID=322095 RepID=UPI001FCA9E89|nr:hypothetical protein [Porphyromonas somerae]BDE81677.1 hypothetical protein CE91St14_07050 [Porphyromonas somerae]